MKISLFILFTFAIQLWAEPRHILFTYMGNPSTSLTVNWQSAPGESAAVVHYDTVSREGKAEAYRQQATGKVSQIPGLDDRSIYRVSIEDLKPATSYYLIVGNEETGFSSELKVKTIPDDDRAIRFVTGGDMGTSKETRILLHNAASYDPDFAAVGGDIAYANGRISSVDKWDTWMDYYTEEMVTSDGYTIPVVFAIGNHEVRGSYNKPKEDAPFFFGLFGQDDEHSYFSRQFGQNLVMLVLDSGHVATHESQVEWIQQAFETYKDVPHKTALYHVPLFPSHRDFTTHFSEEGRQYWAPLFDKYGLTVGFENHDHTFKRSHIIKDGAVSEDGTGTLYLGDGCWGREGREVSYAPRPYLKLSGSFQHFWVVDSSANTMLYRAVDLDNQVFDMYPETAPGAEEARDVFASKEQTYIMPDGVIQVEEENKENNLWVGGDVKIRVRNPFPYPVNFFIEAHYSHEKIDVTGLPQTLKIGPGEEHIIPTSFQLSEAAGPEIKEQMVYLKPKMELVDPEVEKSFIFRQTYSLKLVRSAE